MRYGAQGMGLVACWSTTNVTYDRDLQRLTASPDPWPDGPNQKDPGAAAGGDAAPFDGPAAPTPPGSYDRATRQRRAREAVARYKADPSPAHALPGGPVEAALCLAALYRATSSFSDVLTRSLFSASPTCLSSTPPALLDLPCFHSALFSQPCLLPLSPLFSTLPASSPSLSSLP